MMLLKQKYLVVLIPVLLIVTSGLIYKKYVGWRIEPLRQLLEYVPFQQLRVCMCSSDRDITIKRADGINIAGSLYGVENDSVTRNRPAILVVHGNTPYGRKLPVYKVVSAKLADNGYIVLSIDRAGSGDSDSAFALGTVDSIDPALDVETAVQYLETRSEIDTDKIYVVGHSGGTIGVVRAAISSPLIKKIVSIGPPRRTRERLNDLDDREYFWERKKRQYRLVYGEELPDWYTKDVWLMIALERYAMEGYVEYFKQPSHKPILLMDGQLESIEDRSYLNEYFSTISGPKKYVTVKDSDHYLNTAGVLWFNFYDINVLNETITTIVDWLEGA